MESQPRTVPLIERRKVKPSGHPMCLQVPQPNTARLLQQEPLPKKKRNPQNRKDPELQELKGFMELGFDFSQLDTLSPRVLDLLPGLKRLLTNQDNSCNNSMEFQESPWEDCKLPNPNVAGVDLKENLKLWARSVASTLKC